MSRRFCDQAMSRETRDLPYADAREEMLLSLLHPVLSAKSGRPCGDGRESPTARKYSLSRAFNSAIRSGFIVVD
jgi:hypothetical protein